MSLSQQNKFQAGTSTAAGVLDFPDVKDITLFKPIPFEGIFKDATREIDDLLFALELCNTLQFGGTDEGKADENMDEIKDEIIDAIEHSMHCILRLFQKVEKRQIPTWEDEKKYRGIKGTTLLEPMPFDGSFEIGEVDRIRRLIGRKKKKYRRKKKISDGYTELVKIVHFGHEEFAIRVGPVLQVLSVSISNKGGPSWNDLKICAEISVADEKQNIFDIYKLELDGPELVTPASNDLFLDVCPMAPVMGGWIKFSLTNLVNKDRIFEGVLHSEESIRDPIEETSTIVFDSKDGYSASVVFTVMPFAVIVHAMMFLTYTPPPDSKSKTTSEVYGTIKVNKVVCFDRKSFMPEKISSGKNNLLGQSRCVFAVPVQTPLVVEISLRDGDGLEVAEEKHNFYPRHLGVDPSVRSVEVACKDKSYCFGMDIVWVLHEQFFCSHWWAMMWNENMSPVQLYRGPTIGPTYEGLMEVFSVSVGGYSKRPPALYGSIAFQDQHGSDYIFARKPNCPDKLHGGTVSLAWPDRCVLMKGLYMRLELKDKHGGKKVCRGILRWLPYEYSTCERRMCGFIKGEDGCFVAVHYSLFKNGKQAKVSLKWRGDYSLVYGNVVAEYSNYDYPSNYDKEYYRSIIFRRSEDDGVKVNQYSELPLSKGHVSAPSDCEGLIVHVNLSYHPFIGFSKKHGFMPSDSQHAILCKLGFMANGKTQFKCCECITVKVEWPDIIPSKLDSE